MPGASGVGALAIASAREIGFSEAAAGLGASAGGEEMLISRLTDAGALSSDGNDVLACLVSRLQP